MIEPGELHRYFKVRHVADGRDVWIMAGDTRYAVTGDGLRDYRPDPHGEYFLARSRVDSHPWGWPLRLEDVEPLPDGAGLYAIPDDLHLAMSYEGSWRQYAGQMEDAA